MTTVTTATTPLKKISELVPSVIRTVTPYIVGGLITFLIKHGVNLTADQTLTLGIGVSSVLYSIIRWAEINLSDKFGYLLGYKKKPVYVDAPAVVTDTSGTVTVDSASKGSPATFKVGDDEYSRVPAAELPDGDVLDSTEVDSTEGAPE
jgi:hypothetical protein